MTSDDLSFLLKLEDDATLEVLGKHYAKDAKAAKSLEFARAAISPLSTLDDDLGPSLGLAQKTISRILRRIAVAASSHDASDFLRHRGRRARLDAAVAASVFILFTGFCLGSLGRVSRSYAEQGCRANLFRYFHGLETYASAHAGRYPEIVEKGRPSGTFVSALAQGGVLDARTTAGCPAVRTAVHDRGDTLDYAYSLGYRGVDGVIRGPVRSESTGLSSMALMADRPISGWVPRPAVGNHNAGANVLFADGSVRFCGVPTVGWAGDHIYVNQAQQIAAGLHQRDAVLGEKDDRP